MKSFRHHAKGFAWTGVDQVLSSLSNVVISLALARAGGAEALGAYAVAFAGYLLILGFLRSLISEPLLVLKRERNDHADAGALTITLLFGLPVAAITAIAGLLLGRAEIVALGAVLLPVCIQDVYRFSLFRQHRPQMAAILDALWVAGSVVGGIVLVWVGGGSAAGVLLWGAGGAAGVVVGAWAIRAKPLSVRRGLAWWTSDAKPLGRFLALEGIFYSLASYSVTLGLALILGTGDLGRLRAAEIVIAPAALVLVAFNLYVTPRLVGSAHRTSIQTAWYLSGAAVGLTLVGVTTLRLLAPTLFSFLYGDSVIVSTELLLPIAATLIFNASSAGAFQLLKVAKAGRQIAHARLVSGAFGPPIILLAAALSGLVLAVWGQALQAAVYTVVLWRIFLKQSRRGSRPTTGSELDDESVPPGLAPTEPGPGATLNAGR